MPAAGVVMIIAVLLIVLALVYYLVSTIVALQRITDSLDKAITGVVGIIAGIGMLAALASGLVPALRVSRLNLTPRLNAAGCARRRTRHRAPWRLPLAVPGRWGWRLHQIDRCSG